MKEKFFPNVRNVDVVNPQICVDIIKQINPRFRTLSDSAIVSRVNRRYNKKLRYFTKDYRVVQRDDPDVSIMWIDTGLLTKDDIPIYFQFQKVDFGRWRGALVNTEEGILEYQSAKDSTIYSIYKGESKKLSPVYERIWESLALKDDWSVKSIVSYITVLLNRLNHFISKGKSTERWLLFNKQKTIGIINTGLIDMYGVTIHIRVGVINSKFLLVDSVSEVSNNISLLDFGFDKEDLKFCRDKLERVPFYNVDRSELIFDGDYEDIDTRNSEDLYHCIEERRFRFPEYMQNTSKEFICSSILNAIKTGIMINKYDPTYIKPIYDVKHDRLSFAIPYHMGNTLGNKIDMAIVISKGKKDMFWNIKTVLDYETVIDDIRTISLYRGQSF